MLNKYIQLANYNINERDEKRKIRLIQKGVLLIFLIFKPLNNLKKAANELGVYAANSTVFVNITSESNGTIEVIDLVGKTIYTSNFSGKSGRVAFEVPNAVYGTYLVKLTSNGKVVNQKVVLNQ